MAFNLKSWCDKEENRHEKLSNEYWNMQVGLSFEEKNIAALEHDGEKNAKDFLSNAKTPKELWFGSIGAISSKALYKNYLEFQEVRKNKTAIFVKFKGKPVTWPTWRQFAATAPDKERKKAFDEMITKAKVLEPTITTFFETSKKIYADYDTDPLQEYLYNHRMTLSKLREVLEELRDGIKKPFQKQSSEYFNEILGREMEYYDDFYFLRNKIYDKVKIPKINPVQKAINTIQGLGLDCSKIKLDDEDRTGKYASPFMNSIRIPTDIRISYKPENPLNDLNSMYHEYGHAIHYSSIDPALPYWKKYCTSEGLAETWSIFFDTLLVIPDFLQEIGFNEEIAEDISKRTNYADLFAAAFYCANSMFRINYWDKNLSIADCDEEYAKQIKKAMGIEIPGEYWKLHHILPENLMYVPSYMLAEMQVANMHTNYAKEKGPHWWTHKELGKELFNLMKPGTDSPLAEFSKINPKQMIRRLTRR